MDKHLHPDHSCETCKPSKPANSPLWGPHLGRRDFFKIAGTGVAGYFLVPNLAVEAAAETTSVGARLIGSARNVVFVLLNGAPSHVDTFDLKVGPWLPADFMPETFNGVLFPKGLMPTLFSQLDKIGIVRSLRAPALAHGLQQTWVQIARNPAAALGKIAPNVGSVVALEAEKQRQSTQKLPGFLSMNTGGNIIGQGYFSPRYTPFDTTASPTGLTNLAHPSGQTTFERRYQMLTEVDGKLRGGGASPVGEEINSMDGFYQQSRAMMYNGEVDAVFKFTTAEQNRYGTGTAATGFGNSCVVARNLIKANAGTRYIQINLGGWDNHSNIYQAIRNPALQLDRGLGNLLMDLAASPGTKGAGTLLDETLIVAMGEFGRTVRARTGQPGLNDNMGRDHFFQHFTMFAGGGIVGGRIVGATSADGFSILDPGWSQNRPIANEDIAATIYSALGIDYTTTRRDDPFQRGFEYVPFASQGAWYPVTELFTRSVNSKPKLKPRSAR
ncbi:MAG: DUF1501 domain-containing protein [Blastocatellia bacterium]